jgi:hypothetical protein
VPFFGCLQERIGIHRLFNEVLKMRVEASKVMGGASCFANDPCTDRSASHICFYDPFADFTTEEGGLDHRHSDGHVHVRSDCCAPIHRGLADLLRQRK